MSMSLDDLDLLPAEEVMGVGLQLATSCCGSCLSSLCLFSAADCGN